MNSKVIVKYLAEIAANDEVIAVPSLTVALEGIVNSKHFGFTKKADSRDTGIKRGTIIRNWRQWSAVSLEELAVIAGKMNVTEITGAMLSANIVFEGLHNLTASKPGTKLCFPSGAVLHVECLNEPCVIPGRKIAAVHANAKPGQFPKLAKDLRGIVGVVHRAGVINLEDEVSVVEPV